MTETRKCPYSGELFKPKRSNQKFASKKNRIAYYNQQYKKKRWPLKRINQKLFFNYSILELALKDKTEVMISNDYLRGKGFDFKFITHLINGNENFYGLYDIMFKKFDNDHTQIIRNESINII